MSRLRRLAPEGCSPTLASILAALALWATPASAQPAGKGQPARDAPSSRDNQPKDAPQAKDGASGKDAATAAPAKDGAGGSTAVSAPTGRGSDDASGDAAEEAARKDEARVRFERGVGLFEQQAWTAALAEFLASRGLYATRAATKNAAVCLRKLERFDEALDLFEALLREFPNLPPADKTFAQREVTDLRALVATIDVDGAEPGATVVIDGRSRADFPLVAPLRVPAGTHVVRVFKEGFEPFETRVDVPGGQRVAVRARLEQLTAAGRLRVGEKGGRVLDVLVDGAVVGKTPWEGRLGPGNHVVVLRGEGTLGTEPAAAAVKDRELTNLVLAAEPLEASLLVTATPSGAGLSVNSVSVGHGVWDGRLRAATHTIEVAQEGFVAARQQVALGRGERKVITLDLERDPDAAIWRKPSRIVVEAGGAFGLAPSFGGDVAGCGGSCSSGVGVGVLATARASYELGSGLGFGIAAGYLLARQSVEGRSAELSPQGLAPIAGTVDDELLLQGFVVAATGGVRFGERFPVQLRLGAGALLAQVRDARTGRSSPAAFPGAFPRNEHGELASATYLWLDPEVRVGLPIGKHFELSAGLELPILVALAQPRWGDDGDIAVNVPGAGYATYRDDALTGKVVVLVAPGLGARWAF